MNERLSKIDDKILTKRYESVPFLKKLNNEAHVKRIEFWKNEVNLTCIERKMVCLSVERLEDIYKRKDGSVPLCLGRVLAEMECNGNLVKMETFLTKRTTLYDVVMSPVRWVWSDDSVLEEPSGKDVFVSRRMLDVVRKDVVARLRERGLFSESFLRDTVSSICEKEDVEFVIENLKLQQDVVVLKEGCYAVDASEVTEIDRSIYQLRSTLDALVEQERSLETLAQNLKLEAKRCVKENRSKAVALLKRKKLVDDALAKRLGITTNVQEVLLCAEGLKSDQMAFQAIKQGSSTMKSVQEKSGLSVEAIEDVMNEFYQLEQEQREVNELIAKSGSISDQDVEEELQGLIEQEELEKQLEMLSISTPRQNNSNSNNNNNNDIVEVNAEGTAIEESYEKKEKAKKQLVLE